MSPELQRARAATFALFVLAGFVSGMWVVNIPAISERTSVGHEGLGYLFLLMGSSAVVGMQIGGAWVDRIGSGRVSFLAGVAAALSLFGPAFATSWVTLSLGIVMFGLGHGLIDVSMNAHAVEVERGYGRPIMAAFHALYSAGGLVAAVYGGAMLGADFGPPTALPIAAGAAILVAFAARPFLLVTAARPAPPPGEPPLDPSTIARPTWSPRVALLAGLAFLLFLGEGVAYDWSTVHLSNELDASDKVAAYAFGSFSVAMMIVRLVADRIVHRIGPTRYVQIGTLVGASGLAIASLSADATVAIVGWTIFGIGLAGCIPQFFTAAGNIDPDNAGTYLARVTAGGYAGMLAGPSIIGILTRWVPLTTAFWVSIIGIVAAGTLAALALRSEPLEQTAD